MLTLTIGIPLLAVALTVLELSSRTGALTVVLGRDSR